MTSKKQHTLNGMLNSEEESEELKNPIINKLKKKQKTAQASVKNKFYKKYNSFSKQEISEKLEEVIASNE